MRLLAQEVMPKFRQHVMGNTKAAQEKTAQEVAHG
jgi:hypothetical protein